MLRQKREKSGTGICHVMQGKESKTCPYDSLHIGNDNMITNNGNMGDNYYGIYLGSENPENSNNMTGYFYAVPPIDKLDYAAFMHDKAYDAVNAKGVDAALFNRSVYWADWQLTKRALNDAMTSKIGSERWCWGIGAGVLFGAIAVDKFVNIPRGLIYDIIR